MRLRRQEPRGFRRRGPSPGLPHAREHCRNSPHRRPDLSSDPRQFHRVRRRLIVARLGERDAGILGRDVQVEVEHRLVSLLAIVLAQEDPVGMQRRRLRLGQPLRDLHQMREHARADVHQVAGVLLGDDQQIAAADRVDVHESEDLAVLIDLGGRQRALEDAREGIVVVIGAEQPDSRSGRGARRDSGGDGRDREQRQRGEGEALPHRVGTGSTPV